jgi:hypothetical protein
MRKELTITELDAEFIELLPERETLSGFGNFNWASVYASNSSLALNAATVQSAASSAAYQSISVTQGG